MKVSFSSLFRDIFNDAFRTCPGKRLPISRSENLAIPECLRKSLALGFGSGLLILPKTETQWIFRNLVFCKAELPPKTREKTDFGLAQFVSFKNICLLAYTP